MTATSAEPAATHPCPEWCDQADNHPIDSVVDNDQPARTHGHLSGSYKLGADISVIGVLPTEEGVEEKFDDAEIVVYIDGDPAEHRVTSPGDAFSLARHLAAAASNLRSIRDGRRRLFQWRPTRRVFGARPIAEHPGDQGWDKNGKRMTAPEGQADLFGGCAEFCISYEPRGATVEQHGDRCSSRSTVVEGASDDGTVLELYTTLVKPYLHGRYDIEDIPTFWENAPRMQFDLLGTGIIPDVGQTETKDVTFAVAETRSLIRHLTYWADRAEQLHDGRELEDATGDEE